MVEVEGGPLCSLQEDVPAVAEGSADLGSDVRRDLRPACLVGRGVLTRARGGEALSDTPPSSSRRSEPTPRDPAPGSDDRERYWRANLRWVIGLLALWFLVSFGAGILLAPTLDAIRLPGSGFPLGFWFAQQGAIYVFVLLIFVYVRAMNRLDRRYGVEEEEREGGE